MGTLATAKPRVPRFCKDMDEGTQSSLVQIAGLPVLRTRGRYSSL